MSIGYDVKTLNTGLIAYWKLDEGDGEIAYDSVNEFHGVVYGASWINGKIGSALNFDGENDYINLPQSAIDFIGSLNEGTIAFWFNYNYNLDQQEIQPMFYIGIDDENEPDNMFIIEVGHKNPANRRLYVTWVVGRRIPLCFDTGFNLEEKRWYHFAVVVGPNGNTGYLDGVELIDRHYNFGKATDSYFFSDIPIQEQFIIGYGKTADGKCPHFLYFDGMIDDVRIYDKPLNADEIMELYNYNGNDPPNKPDINGPISGKPGEELCWTIKTCDPDGDDIKYIINWGDSISEETDCYPSCTPVTVCHNWSKRGKYQLSVRPQDCPNGLIGPQVTLELTIPRIKAFYNSFLLRFIDMFPILQRILNLIV